MMRILDMIEDWWVRRTYRHAERFLTSAPAERIAAHGHRRALEVFRLAARTVPAYRRRLEAAGLRPEAVTTIDQFRSLVPILDKSTVFGAHPLRDLCFGGSLDDAAFFHSSSGASGAFSFGVGTRAGTARAATGVEFILDINFDIFKRRTLLINALPMGVRIPTRTLAVADAGIRADVVGALVKGLADDFDQFILVGEHLLLKKAIEEGADSGIPWRNLVVHVVTGGEFISETFRTYLGHLLGTDSDTPGRGRIMLNMGLSELTLSIFQDTRHTMRIRRAAQEDQPLRYALFGEGTAVCPEIMQYNPTRTYLETVPDAAGRPELVVSLFGPDLVLPLIRYNTHDIVGLMDYATLSSILRKHGRGDLIPPAHLPVGLIRGKDQAVDLGPADRISVVDVKEALYRDFDVAGRVTGFFRLMKEQGRAVLVVQLRGGRAAAQGSADSLGRCLAELTPCPVEVRLVPYEGYPYSFDLNYEVKPRYI